MSTLKWAAPESLTAYLSTELNSLASASFSSLGAAISNSTDLYEYIGLELVLAAQGANRAAGATVEVWAILGLDATYETDSNAKFAQQFLSAFPLDDGALAARRLNLRNIPIPPFDFKLQVKNVTGQAFASSGNTLKYRRYNEQSV